MYVEGRGAMAGLLIAWRSALNIAMPENPLNEIDRYAEQYHMSRTGLLAQAPDQSIHRKQSAKLLNYFLNTASSTLKALTTEAIADSRAGITEFISYRYRTGQEPFGYFPPQNRTCSFPSYDSTPPKQSPSRDTRLNINNAKV